MAEISRPETISRFKKQRFLLSLAEDAFRDGVVRPLFLRQGLRDGRDLCGPSEEGKDAYFLTTDRLGIDDLYVVQTKKGNLNLTRKASENLTEAIAQLRTAAETAVSLVRTRQKKLPAKVILCASGTINDSARRHIVEAVRDPRLEFLDADELIPRLDEHFPELWMGVDAKLAPYLRRLISAIEASDETVAVTDLLPREQQGSVAAGPGFVMLQLYRFTTRVARRRGQARRRPELEQIAVLGVLKRRSALIAIFGGAGSGKSTSLKRIAYLTAKRALAFEEGRGASVPFLLRAPELLARGAQSLVEACDAESKRLTNSGASVFTVDQLGSGRVLVLVDALDEIPDESGRSAVLGLVEEFHSTYPLCRVVVTARDDPSVKRLPALAAFESFYVSPIDYKQAQSIIEGARNGEALPPEKSQELVRRLEQVHGVELNPLLVTVFAATSDYSRQDIPANITELFKKFTEMMLGRWDAGKGVKHQYHAPLKDFILKRVAFEMHRTKETAIPTERLDQIISSELKSRGQGADAVQLRDEMVVRSGLFREDAGTVSFRHLLVQEFFAGRGIPSPAFLESVVADGWWSRAIVFYFGEHPDAADALLSATLTLDRRSPGEKFQGAATLGLALQACYLTEITDKKRIYRWVVDRLADSVAMLRHEGKPTLMGFVVYYLFGRDSVALSAVQGWAREALTAWDAADIAPGERDLRVFWVLAGLVECGAVSEVEAALAWFSPADPRLLLALHLGCTLAVHVRVCPKDQRRAAERACGRLRPRVEGMRQELIAELKSELLEVREGTVKILGPGDAAAGPATD